MQSLVEFYRLHVSLALPKAAGVSGAIT